MTLDNNSLEICQMHCVQTKGPLPQLLGVPCVRETALIMQLN